MAEAVFSPDSDAKLWLVEAPARPAAAAPGWSVLPVLPKADYEAFVNRGVLSGDAGQYMLGAGQSEADPDRIYTCQDSGGVWVSLDHGNSWNNLTNRGLYARTTTGIAVDPLEFPAGLPAYPGRRRHCGARSYRAAALARRRD